jgi:pimeloyl-ACP methyl ester carboxylesterase
VILIAPVSGDQAFGRASNAMIAEGQKNKDTELHYLGLSRSFNGQTGKSSLEEYEEQQQIPRREGEDQSIDRRSWSLMFANPHDNLLALLYPVKDRILGPVAIPEFSVTREPKLKCPVLIVVGQHTMYTDINDCKTVQKHYGAQMVVYKGSANMPHAEESIKFNKDVRKFLSRGR